MSFYTTVARVAEAFNLPGQGVNLVADGLLRMVPDSVTEVSMRMILDGFKSWKTHLFDFVDAFRATNQAGLLDPPASGLEARLQALCASTVEALCAEKGLKPPPWCAGVPALDRPWFVAGIENLKAMALVESKVPAEPPGDQNPRRSLSHHRAVLSPPGHPAQDAIPAGGIAGHVNS